MNLLPQKQSSFKSSNNQPVSLLRFPLLGLKGGGGDDCGQLLTDEEGERSLVFSAGPLGTPALSSCGVAEAKTRRIGLIELWLSVGRSGEAAVWRRGVNSVVGSAGGEKKTQTAMMSK